MSTKSPIRLGMAIAAGLFSVNGHAQTYQIIDTPAPGLTLSQGYSQNPKVDAYGRNIVFISNKKNFFPNEPAEAAPVDRVILVRRTTGARRVLAAAPSVTLPLSSGYQSLAISGDGRTIAYISRTGDGINYEDCFYVRVDDNLNITQQPTRIQGSGLPVGACQSVSINHDGSIIALSKATPVPPPPPPIPPPNPPLTSYEIYRYHVASAAAERVSNYLVPADNRGNEQVAINSSSTVVWHSRSDKLVAAPIDNWDYPHVFAGVGGAIFRVDRANTNLCGIVNGVFGCGDHFGNGGSDNPSVSDFGQVAFHSGSSALLSTPVLNRSQIYRSAVGGGASVLISGVGDTPGNSNSQTPAISAITEETVFMTLSTNLGLADPGGSIPSIVLHNAQGQLEMISAGNADGPTSTPDISARGEVIVYAQNGGTVIGNPMPGNHRIIAFDRFSNRTYDLRTSGYNLAPYILPLVFENVGDKTALNALVTVVAPGEFIVANDGGACQVTGQSPKRYECRYPNIPVDGSVGFDVQNMTPDFLELNYTVSAAGSDTNLADNSAFAVLCARKVYCR